MHFRVVGASVFCRRHGSSRSGVIHARGFSCSEVSVNCEVEESEVFGPAHKRRSSPSSQHPHGLDFLVKQLDDNVDSSDYARLLKRCTSPTALPAGRRIHEHLVSRGKGEDVHLGNLLLEMYGKCGSVEDCYQVFQGMKNRDASTWSMLVSASALNGKNKQALGFYREMLQAGFRPTEGIYITLVKVCGSIGAVAEGKLVHFHIREMNYDESHTEVTSSLIKMYGKFRLAEGLFGSMACKDVTSYSAMITAYAKCSQPRKALDCFERMWSEGLKPSVIIFNTVLGVCAELRALEAGCRVHAMVEKVGYSFIHTLNVALFDMYARCGEVERARDMFDKFKKADITTWNLMIASYARKGCFGMATELADRLEAAGLKPTVNTFLSLLEACNQLDEVVKVRSQVQASRLAEGVVTFNNALITKLGRLGLVGHARDVLCEMPEKNVVSWSAMIAAYVHNGLLKEGLLVLQHMDLEGLKPDNVTFTSLMNACYDEKDARTLHNRVCSSRGADGVDDSLRNAILGMLIKSGNIAEARETFEAMETKDVITWTTMIGAVVQEGCSLEEAFTLFQRMELEGVKPTSVTFLSLIDASSSLGGLEVVHKRILDEGYRSHSLLKTALVKGYARYQHLVKARACFNEIETKDVVAWTSMIRGYAEQQQGKDALLLFHQMQLEGVKPSHVTLVIMLKVCTSSGFVHQGRKIHAQLNEAGGESDSVVGSELVNMYGQFGSLEDAKAVFDKIQHPGNTAWTTLISASTKSGRGTEVVKYLRYMEVEGMKPNRLTLTTALAACTHSGMQDEAWDLLIDMGRECRISVNMEHYGYMIDMLGRAGQMKQAQAVINNMGVRPDAKIWMNLLSACKMHKQWELGSQAGEQLLQLEPLDSSVYVLLAEMYSEAGNREKEAEMLSKMENNGK